MARRGGKITPFSRDYRRPPRWGMGVPRRRRRPAPGGFRRLVRHPIGWLLACGLVVVLGSPVADAASGLLKSDGGCRVLMVVDGDTVRMYCPASGVRVGRLVGFDTPKYRGDCLSERMGAFAATYQLRWFLWTAGSVRVTVQGRDRYGRDLATLMIDGEGIGRRMVASGWARPYQGGRRASWCGGAAVAS